MSLRGRAGLLSLLFFCLSVSALAAECVAFKDADSSETTRELMKAGIALGSKLDEAQALILDKLLAVYSRTPTGAKRLAAAGGCPSWPIVIETGRFSDGEQGFTRPSVESIHVIVDEALLLKPGEAFSVLAHELAHAERKRCFPSTWANRQFEASVSKETRRVFDEAAARVCGFSGSFSDPKEPGWTESEDDQIQDLADAAEYWGGCRPGRAEDRVSAPILSKGVCPSPNENFSCSNFTAADLSLARANCDRGFKQQLEADKAPAP